ncbi:MAG TPA: LapA family protein [Albitalea sp.]
MRLRTVFAILAIGLLAAFAALNWQAFTTPTRLDLMFAAVDAPLGLVMLVLLGLVTLVFAVNMAVWQGTILMESRRNAKELAQQRALADQAEASRFSELRAALRDEVQLLDQRMSDVQEAVRADLRESTNSLASMIGELDDRLTR